MTRLDEAVERVKARIALYKTPGAVSYGGVVCSAADLTLILEALSDQFSKNPGELPLLAHARLTREEIARIIDPAYWAHWDITRLDLRAALDPPSLKMADAILALSPVLGGGGVELGSSPARLPADLRSTDGQHSAGRSDLLERALWIAAEAHSGQIDKGGAPYILHVKRVCQAVSAPDDRIAAALHDVLEDGPGWGVRQLREAGFPEHIISAVKALTRRPDESYSTFIERVSQNHIAVRVKLADLADNSNLSRLPEIRPSDRARATKYAEAVVRLSSVVERASPSEASTSLPATDEPISPLPPPPKEGHDR